MVFCWDDDRAIGADQAVALAGVLLANGMEHRSILAVAMLPAITSRGGLADAEPLVLELLGQLGIDLPAEPDARRLIEELRGDGVAGSIDETLEIDGSAIRTKEEVLAALGVTLEGCGSSLAAFWFRVGFGLRRPTHLRWIYVGDSRRAVGDDEFDAIVGVLDCVVAHDVEWGALDRFTYELIKPGTVPSPSVS